MKIMGMYFFQGTVIRKALTTLFYIMLYRSKEKGKGRHNSGLMHWKKSRDSVVTQLLSP